MTMKWDAWGDPKAAKPLSDGIRGLLKQALGVGDASLPELEPSQVRLRPSTAGVAWVSNPMAFTPSAAW